MNKDKKAVALGIWFLFLGVLQTWYGLPLFVMLNLIIAGAFFLIAGWVVYQRVSQERADNEKH